MKLKMLSFMTGKDFEYKPGDTVEVDEAEAERLLNARGARTLSDEEVAAELEREVAAKAAERPEKSKSAK